MAGKSFSTIEIFALVYASDFSVATGSSPWRVIHVKPNMRRWWCEKTLLPIYKHARDAGGTWLENCPTWSSICVAFRIRKMAPCGRWKAPCGGMESRN